MKIHSICILYDFCVIQRWNINITFASYDCIFTVANRKKKQAIFYKNTGPVFSKILLAQDAHFSLIGPGEVGCCSLYLFSSNVEGSFVENYVPEYCSD